MVPAVVFHRGMPELFRQHLVCSVFASPCHSVYFCAAGVFVQLHSGLTEGALKRSRNNIFPVHTVF